MKMQKKCVNAMLVMLMASMVAACATSTPDRDKEGALSNVQASLSAVSENNPAKGSREKSAKEGGESLTEAERRAVKEEGHRLYPGTGQFVTSPPAAKPSIEASRDVTLNFEGAELREVIRAVLGDILGEGYVIDPRVQGSVTVHTSQPLSKSSVIPTLEMLLRMNGAAMVREDGIYKIIPSSLAIRGSTPQLGGADGVPLASGHSVQIVPLKFIAAREMAKILEPLLPEGGLVRVDEIRNILMLAGGERELRHALETVSMFDVDWLAGMSVGLFSLQNTEVKAILPELQMVFGENAKGPFAGLVRVIPIERMNALFVVTSQPKYLEQARIWVERLDKSSSKGGGTRLFVYPVQNGKADKIAALLSQLLGGKGAQSAVSAPALAPGLQAGQLQSSGTSLMNQPSTASSPGVVASGSGEALGLSSGSTIKIIADKDNNALLILANGAEYEKIEEAVRKLDVIPRQVLVEVTIAEVTLDGVLQYGLEWYFNNANNVSGQLTNVGALAPTFGEVAPKKPFTAIWSGAGGNVKAVLSALASDSRIKILSSPHVMVTDNQAAQIKVGDSVPIQGSTTVTTAGTPITSVQYVDTGILLEVRPHINAGGLVTMEIKQEVSDPAVTTSSALTSPTINRRSAQSIVSVQSGETMVLAGLIKDRNVNSSGGLPLLSEMPILGGLFGAQDREQHRTELIVLITPRVVNNSQQAREITQEFRAKLVGLKPAVVGNDNKGEE